MLKCILGIWDHIKNRGDHGAENFALDWIQFLPGKRESRRLIGEYVLNENDIISGRIFEDAVAYGGWPIDVHTSDSIFSKEPPIKNHIKPEDVYTIPYRCLYSKNINNLMMAGRIISSSNLAHGSVRVMGTCSVTAQAAGTAAALAIKEGMIPSLLMPYISKL